MLACFEYDFCNGYLTRCLERFPEKRVSFVSSLAAFHEIRLIEEKRVYLIKPDEVDDVHSLSRLHIGAGEVLIAKDDVSAFLILEAFDDLVPWDFFPVLFCNTLVIHGTQIRLAQKVEMQFFTASRRIERNRYVDQPETDGAFPDCTHYAPHSSEGKALSSFLESSSTLVSLSSSERSLLAVPLTPTCLEMSFRIRRIMVVSFSARRLICRSSSARLSASSDIRFWVMRTKSVRKIASRETIVVRRLNGNGSNGSIPAMPTFARIQTKNQTAWSTTAVALLALRVMAAAMLSTKDRAS